MSKDIIVSYLDGVDNKASLLTCLPKDLYLIQQVSPKEITGVLAKLLPTIQADEEKAFIILISREAYLREEEEREIASLITSSGLKAEPVFLVVGKDFTCEEVSRIVQRNNLFFSLMEQPDDSCTFRGYVDKALLDFCQGRKIIQLISNEFMSFIENEEIKSSKEEIEQMNMELESLNRIDELTQLLNRKGIVEYFQVMKGRATRERWRLKTQKGQKGSPNGKKDAMKPAGNLEDFFGHLSCMMIDIDNFKSVNDTYGHLIGDQVLQTLGGTFQEEGIFRKEDVCGRYGGEEFIVILPATSCKHACIPAEKLREEIKKKTFTADDGTNFHVTISIGVSQLEEASETMNDIVNKADIALYQAKETGKDKTVVFDKTMKNTKVSKN